MYRVIAHRTSLAGEYFRRSPATSLVHYRGAPAGLGKLIPIAMLGVLLLAGLDITSVPPRAFGLLP